MKMLSGITKGLPQSGLQGGAGVGVFYIHRMLTSKIAFLQNNPLAAPIGFIVLGHVLKKKPKLASVGAALCGAGGYAGAQVFEVKKSIQAAQSQPATTAGFEDEDDTGAVLGADDIGALLEPGNIGDLDENTTNMHADAYAL